MKWVTREQVAVDRMACAWLIHRFLDPAAEFIFLAEGEQSLPEDAEPFDMPGVRLSHRHGRATFHTMLREYHLTDPVLGRISRLVDEADIVQEVALEPTAPGLDLICRGLRRISPDDQVALEHGRLIYDALYAQFASELGQEDRGDMPDVVEGRAQD
jgi:hypothetical protein